MKKIMYSVLLCAVCATAGAQVSFGPKIGINNSLASTTNTNIKVDPLYIALYAGGFLNYKFAGNFALQVEGLYSGEGAKFKVKGNPTVYTDKLSYFNVPLLVQLVTHGGFYLETGPQIGFLLSANQSANGATKSISGNLNSTAFRWDFGLGFLISHKVGIGLRYSQGLANINKPVSTSDNIKNNVVSLGLSYSFHSKKS
jgi:hypothetical protein